MSFSLCTLSNKNVGGIKCDVARGVLRQLFIFNDDLTAENVDTPATMLTSLITGSRLGKNETGKVFPLPSVEEIADKSEANKEGTLALGYKQILFEGRPAYEVKFFAGTVQMKSLRRWNNKTVGILEFDANSNIWGTVAGGKFKGFQAKIFFAGGKAATGQAVEEGVVTMIVSFLSNSEYFDNNYMMPIEGNITDVEGLVDVQSYIFSGTTNVRKIGFRLPTTQVNKYLNMFDSFEDELADDALFEAFSIGAGGVLTALPITSVAKDTLNQVYNFTFDSTAYNALAVGTKILVKALSPTVLRANDITGIEIDDLQFLKAA
jgi:hypothetical protein